MLRLNRTRRRRVTSGERARATMTVTDHLRMFLLEEANCPNLFSRSETELNGETVANTVCLCCQPPSRKEAMKNVSISIHLHDCNS
jgi:hypothetical protein